MAAFAAGMFVDSVDRERAIINCKELKVIHALMALVEAVSIFLSPEGLMDASFLIFPVKI